MKLIDSSSNGSVARRSLIWISLALTACLLNGYAQDRPIRPLRDQIQGRVKILDDSEFSRAQLNRRKGTVVAEGRNEEAAGFLKAKNYKIEEIDLPTPLRAEVDGARVRVRKAWRVTITGGPFPLRAMPAVIWIDDQPIGFGVESPDLTSISTVTFDQSIFRNGAVVGLSYGMDKEDRTLLTEKIKLVRTR